MLVRSLASAGLISPLLTAATMADIAPMTPAAVDVSGKSMWIGTELESSQARFRSSALAEIRAVSFSAATDSRPNSRIAAGLNSAANSRTSRVAAFNVPLSRPPLLKP